MTNLDYINQKYPIRKSKEDKKNFTSYVVEMLKQNGKDARLEKTKGGKNTNIVVGNPERARVVFTAHYDTPATSVVPNLMMPRNRVLLFIFHMLPIFVILALSLIPAFLISEAANQPMLYPVIFLILYYGLFYVLYLAFTNKNNYNDNTSGVATLLDIIEKLSEEQIKKCAFIFFDNEEKGKLGSKAYFKDHKEEMNDKLVINFDCVGNGDNILFIAMKKALENEEYKIFKNSFEGNDAFSVSHFPASSSAGNSDHKSFPMGVCCMACSKTKNGVLYTARIHTNKDTVAKQENIDFLSEGIKAYLDNL